MALRNWLAISLIAVAIIAGSTGVWRAHQIEIRDRSAAEPEIDHTEDFDRFHMTDVEAARFSDDGIHTRIVADRIVHKTRRSGSLIYYNLKEIYVYNMRLEVAASGKQPIQLRAEDLPFMSSIFNDKNKQRQLGAVDPRTPETTDDMLTRIVAEGVHIDMSFGKNRQTSISSSVAILKIQDGNINFEGGVVFTDAEGRRLTTSQAIWSNKFSGMLFVQGYDEGKSGTHHSGGMAFFKLTNDGVLIELNPIPPIQVHQDIVEQLENLVWTRMFRYLFSGLP